MESFSYHPAVEKRPLGPLSQTIKLKLDDQVIGTAHWFTTGTDGHVQLLHLDIDPKHRRQKRGTKLYQEVVAQARQFFQSHQQPVRRVTVQIEQKSQVIGRAWLTTLGFHHVGTTRNVLNEQDLLIYLLGLD
jgi:N-acetylglutamate synthase-like GNAT family acetyltransferase